MKNRISELTQQIEDLQEQRREAYRTSDKEKLELFYSMDFSTQSFSVNIISDSILPRVEVVLFFHEFPVFETFRGDRWTARDKDVTITCMSKYFVVRGSTDNIVAWAKAHDIKLRASKNMCQEQGCLQSRLKALSKFLDDIQ